MWKLWFLLEYIFERSIQCNSERSVLYTDRNESSCQWSAYEFQNWILEAENPRLRRAKNDVTAIAHT